MTAVGALFVRELRLATRAGGGALMGALFFLIVVTVVPFGVGPEAKLLARIGPAILWIGALLATLLSLDRLFQADRDDGTLDLILAGETPLEFVVLVKCAAHWVATGLPLVLVSPLLAVLLGMEPVAIGATMLTLALGTPGLTFIGAIGAALTVTLRRGGLLLAVLVLPLTVPILIFGVSAASAVVMPPTPFLAPLLILGALALFAIVIGSAAAAAALRFSAD
jgi:heme exporter protein B